MNTIYQITEQLKNDGFSINFIKNIVERNKGNTSFNTLEYFNIFWFPDPAIFYIEKREHIIEANSFVFVGPGKNICFGENSQIENTIGIAFSSTFYEKSTNDSIFLNSELFFNSYHDIFILESLRTKEQVKQFVVDRLTLYKEKDHGLYISVAHNSIESLILEGLLVLEHAQEIETTKYSYIDFVNKFRVFLQKYYKQNRSVSFYASLLNITPRRLSGMSEELLGKTAKQMIIEKVINESIRVLKYSNLSIAEVTYELGFSDEGNFSSFIKKHTGKNPSEIRFERHLEMKNTN